MVAIPLMPMKDSQNIERRAALRFQYRRNVCPSKHAMQWSFLFAKAMYVFGLIGAALLVFSAFTINWIRFVGPAVIMLSLGWLCLTAYRLLNVIHQALYHCERRAFGEVISMKKDCDWKLSDREILKINQLGYSYFIDIDKSHSHKRPALEYLFLFLLLLPLIVVLTLSTSVHSISLFFQSSFPSLNPISIRESLMWGGATIVAISLRFALSKAVVLAEDESDSHGESADMVYFNSDSPLPVAHWKAKIENTK